MNAAKLRTHLSHLTPDQIREAFRSLSKEEAGALALYWPLWARPNQLPPLEPWSIWLVMAGRGFGKTRTGAQWSIDKALKMPGSRGIIVGRTSSEVRGVSVEGESGIMACSPPDFRPVWEPSVGVAGQLTWPNGTIGQVFGAENPESFRGPQFHWGWADEIGAWRRPESWDQIMFGMRLGENPQVAVTTTPRPVRLIREILKQKGVVVTRGSTYENRNNLAPKFFSDLVAKYEGTRIGRQELNGEVLDDVPGALWTRKNIDDHRVSPSAFRLDLMARIVVGVDPAVTSGEDADETGIVVAGACPVFTSDPPRYAVLADFTLRGSPLEWGRKVVDAVRQYQADRVIVEVNNGGEMVKTVLHTIEPNLPITEVHASRGKRIRAEPIAALYEQGRVDHVGQLDALEDQQCSFVPDVTDGSPDRVDALVWALTELSETQVVAYSGSNPFAGMTRRT